MKVIDTLLLLAAISMALGPLFVFRKTDLRLHRWNRFLVIAGLAESTLMLLIPYEQHVWRRRVFYAGIAALGIAFFKTFCSGQEIERPSP